MHSTEIKIQHNGVRLIFLYIYTGMQNVFALNKKRNIHGKVTNATTITVTLQT